MQLRSVTQPIVQALLNDPRFAGEGPLEDRVARAWRELSLRRRAAAQHAGAAARAVDWFDRVVRTNEPELLDRDDVPQALKLRLVRALHRFNRMTRLLGFRVVCRSSRQLWLVDLDNFSDRHPTLPYRSN